MHAPNSESTAITPAAAAAPPRDETSQNVTKRDAAHPIDPPILTPNPQSQIRNPQSLSPRQLTAISLLTAGKSLTHTAALLHINRMTLYRWRHEHPAFRAELARRQHDLHDTAARRIRLMLLQAVATVTDELANADYEDRIKVAMSLLRHCDLPALLAAPAESPNPDHALDQLIRADWSSRNIDPQGRDVTDYDRQQYLAHLNLPTDAPAPVPTHTRLAGGIPYPTEQNAEPPTPSPA